jgi:hypothetical protein
MIDVLSLLNRLFFPGAGMDIQFEWISGGRVYGQTWDTSSMTSTDRPTGKIDLNFKVFREIPSYSPLNNRAMGRMGTMLHELVHAFFDAYACKMCQSSTRSVNDAKGHGRAWHHVTSLVERAAPRVIGIPLKLGRFDAVINNWGFMQYWPTRDEVAQWRLHNDNYSKCKE